MRTPSKIAAELADAEAAVTRYRAGKEPGNPVYRATAACDMYCKRCEIGCAVATGIWVDLKRELREAVAESGGVLSHKGMVFETTVGSC